MTAIWRYFGRARIMHLRTCQKAQKAAIPVGIMFSWDMPTADLKNYDNGGQIIKSRTQTRRFAYFNHK